MTTHQVQQQKTKSERIQIKTVTSCSTHRIDQQETDAQNSKIRQSKYWVKVQGKLITQAMNGTSVANLLTSCWITLQYIKLQINTKVSDKFV